MAGGRPRKVEQGLPNRTYLKCGTFYYVHRDNKWESLGKDMSQAFAAAKSFNDSKPSISTLAHWFIQWEKELISKVKSGDLAERTKKDYSDAIIRLGPYFGRMDPVLVQPKHIGEYLDAGRDNNRSVRANREKAALSSCFTWLLRIGVVTSNPCKGIKRNKETKRDRWISDEEYHAVYDIASQPVKTWMTLIYRTLQRPSDVLSWTRKNLIDRDGETLIEFRQGKTGRLMSIIINSDIAAELVVASRKVGFEHGALIATKDGKHYTEMGLSSMFRRHVEKAGIEDFALYDLKAKGATDMYKSGVPLETICALCGHESTKTTEIYIKTHARDSIKANDRVLKRT